MKIAVEKQLKKLCYESPKLKKHGAMKSICLSSAGSVGDGMGGADPTQGGDPAPTDFLV